MSFFDISNIEEINYNKKLFRKYFQQKVRFFSKLIFKPYNLQEKTMEESEILNPFGYGKASRVIDENRKPTEWWIDYISINQVIAENEFYVLFEDGFLIKKGKSKFQSSQYLKGDRFRSFRDFHEQVG
jgi:hypothetical protein